MQSAKKHTTYDGPQSPPKEDLHADMSKQLVKIIEEENTIRQKADLYLLVLVSVFALFVIVRLLA